MKRALIALLLALVTGGAGDAWATVTSQCVGNPTHGSVHAYSGEWLTGVCGKVAGFPSDFKDLSNDTYFGGAAMDNNVRSLWIKAPLSGCIRVFLADNAFTNSPPGVEGVDYWGTTKICNGAESYYNNMLLRAGWNGVGGLWPIFLAQ